MIGHETGIRTEKTGIVQGLHYWNPRISTGVISRRRDEWEGVVKMCNIWFVSPQQSTYCRIAVPGPDSSRWQRDLLPPPISPDFVVVAQAFRDPVARSS